MRGHVIDWLMLPNWPVFNVADMCIIGAADRHHPPEPARA